MEDLIKGAFLHAETIEPHVLAGHYDLLSPSGDTLLPALWENSVEPGWEVTMFLWPIEGYQPLGSMSKTQGLPDADLNLTRDPSTSIWQALASAEGVPATRSDVERSTSPKTETDTSHPSSEDEEPTDEEPENRRRMSKWKDRILRRLRTRKLASAQSDLEDD